MSHPVLTCVCSRDMHIDIATGARFGTGMCCVPLRELDNAFVLGGCCSSTTYEDRVQLTLPPACAHRGDRAEALDDDRRGAGRAWRRSRSLRAAAVGKRHGRGSAGGRAKHDGRVRKHYGQVQIAQVRNSADGRARHDRERDEVTIAALVWPPLEVSARRGRRRAGPGRRRPSSRRRRRGRPRRSASCPRRP